MNRRESLRAIGAGALLALPAAPAALLCTAPPAAAPASVETPASAPDPLERARRAWAEFSAALDELTADAHGWMVMGAGHRRARPGVLASDSRWLNVVRIELEPSTEPLHQALATGAVDGLVEQHHRVRL